MAYSFISLTLVLSGLAAAATVLYLSITEVLRHKGRSCLIYAAAALAYGVAMLRYLAQALSPYACSRMEEPVLFACGLLLALHVYFIVRLARLHRRT